MLGHPRMFVALPGDRFALLGGDEAAPSDEAGSAEAETSTDDPPACPWLGNVFRATRDYVILDLETTGLNPKHDRIV